MLGGTWLALHLPAVLATADLACQAHRAGDGFEVLTDAEATELEAITAQIIPTDETPGAREAGVVYFIDRALGSLLAEEKTPVREGLEDFLAQVREAHPEAPAFSALTNNQQIEALRGIEESDFFDTIRSMTIMGMFAHPSYGGNRDKIGWNLLQFEDRPAWQPPFGYYAAAFTHPN